METLTFDEFLDVFDERQLYETIDLYGKSDPKDYEKLREYFEIYQKTGGDILQSLSATLSIRI